MPVAELDNVTVRWGAKPPVLEEVNLTLHAGERLMVVGPSGAGKSTILRLLSGLLLPSAGQLRIHGQEQTYLRLDQRHPPDVRLVFQNPALLASLNVRENVGFLLYRFSRLSEREIRERVSRALEAVGLLGMAQTDPQTDLHLLVTWAVLVALGSATQDIALDAFRIESAQARHQAALAATYQTGYRLAMIWAGAGALWLAAGVQTSDMVDQQSAWRWAYGVMAASMAVGMLTVLSSVEPVVQPMAPAKDMKTWLHSALVEPFAMFIRQHRWHAAWILALIGCYRISDVVMGIMANPFYVDMGYTKEQVAAVSKVFGVVMTLLGAFIGGGLSMRFGIMRILFLGAVLSSASNLLFAWLAGQAPQLTNLIWVVSADNLAGGIASAAFIAYLSSLTQVQYSATQYALFSSMMLLAPKWLAGFSGVFVDAHGYPAFFVATALLGVPVLLLLYGVRHFSVKAPAGPP